jgi:hypothetical protein
VETKTCNKCKEIKSISEFHLDKNKKDGLHTICKICSNDGSKKNRETIYGRILYIFTSAKKRAKEKGLEFNLDFKFLLDLYKSQDGKCKLTDIDFVLEKSKNRIGNFIPFSPSIDKINPFGGYTKNNVRFVCTIVNIALSNHGEDIFDKMCCSYMDKLNKQKLC